MAQSTPLLSSSNILRCGLKAGLMAFLLPGAGPFFCTDAHPQASIVENEPAAIYVDAQTGSDENSGAVNHPVRTLQVAARIAEQYNTRGIGAKVLIGPGIYREFVDLEPRPGQTSSPLTFEAVAPGSAIISGSEVLSDWYNGTGNPAVYTHPWTYAFGQCSIPAPPLPGDRPALFRREMVFVNGSLLKQVTSFAQMGPGTFFVDDAASRLEIWPSAGTDIGSARVEAAVRPQTLRVSHRSNVILRGLVLEHAATCTDGDGAEIYHADNIMIDRVQANWNNSGALGVHESTRVTIQNSVADHNGGNGFAPNKDVVLKLDQSEYNHWRAADAPPARSASSPGQS